MLSKILREKHANAALVQYQRDADDLLRQLGTRHAILLQSSRLVDQLGLLREKILSIKHLPSKIKACEKYITLYTAALDCERIMQEKYYPALSSHHQLGKLQEIIKTLKESASYADFATFYEKVASGLSFVKEIKNTFAEVTDLYQALQQYRKQFYIDFNSQSDVIEKQANEFIQRIEQIKICIAAGSFIDDTQSIRAELDIAQEKIGSLSGNLSNLTVSCEQNFIIPACNALWNVKWGIEKFILRIEGKFPSQINENIVVGDPVSSVLRDSDMVDHILMMVAELDFANNPVLLLAYLENFSTINITCEDGVNFRKNLLLFKTKAVPDINSYEFKGLLLHALEKKSTALLKELLPYLKNDKGIIDILLMVDKEILAGKVIDNFYPSPSFDLVGICSKLSLISFKLVKRADVEKYYDNTSKTDYNFTIGYNPDISWKAQFFTLLHFAIEENWLPGISLLLKEKSDINQLSFHNMIEHFSNMSQATLYKGLTSVEQVIKLGNKKAFSLFVNHYPNKVENTQTLKWACLHNQVHLVKRLGKFYGGVFALTEMFLSAKSYDVIYLLNTIMPLPEVYKWWNDRHNPYSHRRDEEYNIAHIRLNDLRLLIKNFTFIEDLKDYRQKNIAKKEKSSCKEKLDQELKMLDIMLDNIKNHINLSPKTLITHLQASCFEQATINLLHLLIGMRTPQGFFTFFPEASLYQIIKSYLTDRNTYDCCKDGSNAEDFLADEINRFDSSARNIL